MLSFSLQSLWTVSLLGLQITASPIYVERIGEREISFECYGRSENQRQTDPSLPVNGGGQELAAPSFALKYITIGHGVQNYTCTAAGAVPVAVGALAVLYDVDSLRSTPKAIDAIPPGEAYVPNPPNALILAQDTPSVLADSTGIYTVLGHHYFNAAGVPTFDLSAVGDILFGKKTGDIKAPATANKGPAGTGAVDWLQLGDKGGSVGVSQVYRVVTAGGAAPATCSNANAISVPYAAEYWFYD